MNKSRKWELVEKISKDFLKSKFGDLPTPLRILLYGEIVSIIEKATYLKKIYGYRKLEKIWLNNRNVGDNSKEWNEEIG